MRQARRSQRHGPRGDDVCDSSIQRQHPSFRKRIIPLLIDHRSPQKPSRYCRSDYHRHLDLAHLLTWSYPSCPAVYPDISTIQTPFETDTCITPGTVLRVITLHPVSFCSTSDTRNTAFSNQLLSLLFHQSHLSDPSERPFTPPKMSSNSPTSSTNPEHLSSASPELNKQPPFPEPGTDGQRDPPVKHPHAEQLINAAARHLAPEKPAPPAEEDEEKAQLNKPDSPQKEKREEEPLLRGTPLDELLTPGLGLPASPKVDTIKEEERAEKGHTDARQGASKRPGLSAMRGVGSDSVSILPFCRFLHSPYDPSIPARTLLISRYAWVHPPCSPPSTRFQWMKTKMEEMHPKTTTMKDTQVKKAHPRLLLVSRSQQGRLVSYLHWLTMPQLTLSETPWLFAAYNPTHVHSDRRRYGEYKHAGCSTGSC